MWECFIAINQHILVLPYYKSLMYKIKEKKIKKCGLNIYLVTLVDVDNNLGRMTNNKDHNYSG